jgi:hypothetical protein
VLRINPSTIANDKNKHERFVLAKNDQDCWIMNKMRQHAHDPALQFGKSRFEGGNVSIINSSFTKLLRFLARGTNTKPLAKHDFAPSTSPPQPPPQTTTTQISRTTTKPNRAKQQSGSSENIKAPSKRHHRQENSRQLETPVQPRPSQSPRQL